MEKIHVLTTKFLIESEIKRLVNAGLTCSYMPYIEIKSKDDQQTILKVKKIFEESNDQTLFVFTSMNALRFMFLAQKYNGKYLGKIKVACIDGLTYQNSLNFFKADNIVIRAANAAALGEQISKSNFNHIIHFCGNISLGDVSDALSVSNKKSDRVVVYETVLTPHKARAVYDGILFFSPSAVESYYSVNEPDEKSVCFAIGATTSKEILKHHSNKMVVCNKASQSEMITQVIEYFKKKD